jgi:prolyl oligopeptidase
LEIDTRKTLSDCLPRGYLRGFAFAPGGKSFYYVHDTWDLNLSLSHAAFEHVLGTSRNEDREVFAVHEPGKSRLVLFSDQKRIVFQVYRFLESTETDVYIKEFNDVGPPALVLKGISCMLGIRLLNDTILAVTDRNAPNRRIVEIRFGNGKDPEWLDVVPESGATIVDWTVIGDKICVSYMEQMRQRIHVLTFSGCKVGEVPVREHETVRIVGGSSDEGELFLETESFVDPVSIQRCSTRSMRRSAWATRRIPFDSSGYAQRRILFTSKDGTAIPMFLVGRSDVLDRASNPTIMTSYGGYGISMTPQFSVFVAALMELGCLFALPNIRGGSEFGIKWHVSAKRRNRQRAYDDFLSAAEWLIQTGRTAPDRLAIFGGSNSGLLVGAALTQRPDLFRAVVCMVPMLDMLRYHLFDNAHIWMDEFGTAEDPEDFAVLAKYSPYHQVHAGVSYPATMIVSGDADGNCNPFHARKMTARLQAVNGSNPPIILDYSKHRGHSPVLPLSKRIDALTDRIAFVCDQLQLTVQRGTVTPRIGMRTESGRQET